MSSTRDNGMSLPLDQAIRQRYESKEMDQAQLEQLLAIQARLEGGNPEKLRAPIHQSRRVALATLILALTAFLLWQIHLPGQPPKAESIAMEVANNHLKLKPLDVETQSIKKIRGFFTQLDFSPVNSSLAARQFSLTESAMQGGRYCSIQGITAAQLRYASGEDGVSTLYEVAYDPSLFGPVPDTTTGEQPMELLVKGLRVTLWVEKGLLMALVQNPAH